MLNVNKLLQCSGRCELIGSNMMTVCKSYAERNNDNSGEHQMLNHIGVPRFSLSGIFCLGHQTDMDDVMSMNIYWNNILMKFNVVRNIWTPSYMETYYRSEPMGEYQKSGLIIVKEKKCITRNDVFLSEVTIMNDDRDDVELEIEICTKFSQEENCFRCKMSTMPKGLGRKFAIKGYWCIASENGYRFKKKIDKFQRLSFRYSAAFDANDWKKALSDAQNTLRKKDVFESNEEEFNEWFQQNIPILKTDSVDLLKVYYYRWFVVYRNTFRPKEVIQEHFVEGNAVYECSFGGWYGCPIGLPVAMQVEDVKWMRSPLIAKEHLNNWRNGQGCYQGYIQYTSLAAWHFFEIYPDKEWLKQNYDEFKKYLFIKYDVGKPYDLPVTVGSWVTGAEYQPSFYQHTEPEWNYWMDSEGHKAYNLEHSKLYRLDEIMFLAGNVLGCRKMAETLGYQEDYAELSKLQKIIIAEICNRFWNEEDGIFYDIDVKTLKQCDKAACYDSFTPLMWDLLEEEKYDVAIEKMLDENWFWGEFPITTAAKNCPMFWPDNCITGPFGASKKEPHEYGCSWNGPVWPFANTLALTALGDVAKRKEKYQLAWLSFFERYTDLHFLYGDRSLPDIREHYRFSDGTTFSNVDEYFHSCYIDLFMKYWAGIGITDGKITFLPFTKEEFELENIVIHGRLYSFKQYEKDGILCREIKEVFRF